MTLCWEYKKKEAVAAQAMKGPSVRGVRLGAGAGNEVLEGLDLLLLREEDRGLAIMDMSTVYHYY